MVVAHATAALPIAVLDRRRRAGRQRAPPKLTSCNRRVGNELWLAVRADDSRNPSLPCRKTSVAEGEHHALGLFPSLFPLRALSGRADQGGELEGPTTQSMALQPRFIPVRWQGRRSTLL